MDDPEGQAFDRQVEDLLSGKLSYEEAKRRYLQLGDAIQQRYERKITALSLDAVHSREGKEASRALDAQLTFDAYHRWVEQKLSSHGCHSFTWAGDGLLAIFEEPEEAVAVGRALIDALPAFNSRFNRLPRPLQIRIGVHTGPIFGDSAASAGLGKIASPTFDLAGHLQKSADPNRMLISETTYTLLHEGGGQFVPVRRELPNPGACFAYPPYPGSLPERQTPHYGPVLTSPMPQAVPLPAAPQGAPLVPWIFGGVGIAVLTAFLVVAFWPKKPVRQAGPGPSQPVAVNPQPVPPSHAANRPSEAPPPSTTPPANTTPAAPPAQPTPQPAPAWGPSRELWRSPEADSGVPPQFAPSPPERKWLLSIGIGRYRDRAFQADGAGADARFMAQVLARNGGVPEGHSRVLADEDATLDGIKLAFQWLQQNAASGRDTVFVYLSGAGLLAADRPDFRHPSGSGYALAPHDANPQDLQNTMVYGADIAAWLGATRTQTILVLADTSHGAALDVPTAADQGRQFALLAATGVAQRSGTARGSQASVFAETVAAGLRGEADVNRDRRVSLEELTRLLEREVPRRAGGAQTPQAVGGFGGYLPAFYFAVGG
jgi:class 3 adenylate cyclase